MDDEQPPVSTRRDLIPYLIAFTLIAFCLAVRMTFHVPLRPGGGGGADGVGGASTANVADAADMLTYAAWAQQCRRGDFLMGSLYTIEPHRAILFNPYFAFVGLVARWTGVHVLLVMNVLGLIAAGAAVILTYHVALALDFGRTAARMAALFLAFGSGLTGCQHWISQLLLGRMLLNGADVVFMDSIGHSTFVVFPYHAVALALLVLLVWVIVRAVRPAREGQAAPRRTRYIVISFFLALLLSWVHPYEILLPLLAMIGWVILGHILIAPNDSTKGVRTILCIVLAVAAAPQVLFGIYLSSQPVWDEFARYAREVPISSRQWIVGFGLLLVLAIIGCRRVLARGLWSDAGGWIFAWFVAVVVLLIALQIRFTKIVDGASIMMSLLAGVGAATLWSEAASRRNPGATFSPMRAALVVLLIIPFTTPILLLDMYRAYASGAGNPPCVYDAEIATVLGDPNHLTGPRLDVLCDARTGGYLPGLYGYRVFAGHWTLTPDRQPKYALLASAGFTPPRPATIQPTPDDTPMASLPAFQRLLGMHPWDRILVSRDSEAGAFMRGEPEWDRIAESSRWLLFSRTPPRRAVK